MLKTQIHLHGSNFMFSISRSIATGSINNDFKGILTTQRNSLALSCSQFVAIYFIVLTIGTQGNIINFLQLLVISFSSSIY